MSPSQTHSAVVIEGRAVLDFSSLSRSVFYNPRMSINRDIAVLFANSHFGTTKLRICDPMAGSGVRAVRYLLEARNIASVIAGDRESAAAELASETAKRNGLGDRMSVVCADAHTLLSNHAQDRFDLIDLDPFGSPAPFFDAAVRATADGRVLAATATDMGPLSGARPKACLRKYAVWTLRTEFEKEIALRTLVSSLESTAARLELGLNLAFAHATDHYARVYAVIRKSRRAANQSLSNQGYISYCPNCLSRHEAESISSVQSRCVNCGKVARVGGPFWLGPLWDDVTVASMVRRAATLTSSRLSDVQKMLSLIEDESHAPRFYFTTGAVASVYGVEPPSVTTLIETLRDAGYQGTRTHLNPTGFRTDAPLASIVASFRAIAEKT